MNRYFFALSPSKEIRNNSNTRSGEKETAVRDRRTGQNKATKRLRYPYRMLDDNTDYLKIDIAEYQPPRLDLQGLTPTRKEGKVTFNDASSSETFKSLQLQTGTRSNAENLKKPKSTIQMAAGIMNMFE